MKSIKFHIVILFLFLTWTACKTQIHLKAEEKVFHAGPVNSGFSGIYFGLYKNSHYQFCDGDFMDAGCYTGNYDLIGDTIILRELKKHKGIPTNRFLIRRYLNMDSNYWKWKYPHNKDEWKSMKYLDSINGSTGDVFPLDQKNRIVLDKNNYFLIRRDRLR